MQNIFFATQSIYAYNYTTTPRMHPLLIYIKRLNKSMFAQSFIINLLIQGFIPHVGIVFFKKGIKRKENGNVI